MLSKPKGLISPLKICSNEPSLNAKILVWTYSLMKMGNKKAKKGKKGKINNILFFFRKSIFKLKRAVSYKTT